jgi:hypothetical protein
MRVESHHNRPGCWSPSYLVAPECKAYSESKDCELFDALDTETCGETESLQVVSEPRRKPSLEETQSGASLQPEAG